MMTNHQKKFIVSLKQKKFRIQHNSFVVEGVKMVDELLQSDYEVASIFATQFWIENHPAVDAIEISEKELNAISSLKTPNQVLAVVKKKKPIISSDSKTLTLVLDNIQDPGNLGTIIRTADWFGVKNIVCSEDCVEVYNPKVLQATMGSFFRVNTVYTDLCIFLTEKKVNSIYGALLDGENVYTKKLNTNNSMLVVGNESKGISDNLLPFINERLTIPKIGKAESLNAATATAILCAEFFRK
ncbi:MAG: RNA methyltransferase [Vicingus serpentipes]|nr:RNA methyltransferase [Vicingus serpentipes]